MVPRGRCLGVVSCASFPFTCFEFAECFTSSACDGQVVVTFNGGFGFRHPPGGALAFDEERLKEFVAGHVDSFRRRRLCPGSLDPLQAHVS